MKTLVTICALVCMAATASAVWVDIEGIEPPAFEESALGTVEVPWVIDAGTANNVGCPNDNTHVYEGYQSALIPGPDPNVLTFSGIYNAVTLGTEGEYEFMFYDDMAASKNARAGLKTAPSGGAWLGTINVETNKSATNYVALRRWTYLTLTVARSLGWHHMTIKWYPGGSGQQVDFYVDGTLGGSLTDTYLYSAGCEYVGAPFGTKSPAWVDSVPEPAAVVLLAVGSLLMVPRRRRA